jgi:hypothetical protein
VLHGVLQGLNMYENIKKAYEMRETKKLSEIERIVGIKRIYLNKLFEFYEDLLNNNLLRAEKNTSDLMCISKYAYNQKMILFQNRIKDLRKEYKEKIKKLDRKKDEVRDYIMNANEHNALLKEIAAKERMIKVMDTNFNHIEDELFTLKREDKCHKITFFMYGVAAAFAFIAIYLFYH